MTSNNKVWSLQSTHSPPKRFHQTQTPPFPPHPSLRRWRRPGSVVLRWKKRLRRRDAPKKHSECRPEIFPNTKMSHTHKKGWISHAHTHTKMFRWEFGIFPPHAPIHLRSPRGNEIPPSAASTPQFSPFSTRGASPKLHETVMVRMGPSLPAQRSGRPAAKCVFIWKRENAEVVRVRVYASFF